MEARDGGSLGGTSLCMIFDPTQVNVTIPSGGRQGNARRKKKRQRDALAYFSQREASGHL